MTRLVVFLMLIHFTVQPISAQYTPIVSNDSITWNLKHEVPDAAQMEKVFLGDTITIDTLIYHEIFHEWYGHVGYFREDTTDGKAWFRGVTSSHDTLIMDLGLSVGDTFEVRTNIHGHTLNPSKSKVISVDTIRGRKTITLDFGIGGGFISENLKFIEGIGPNASLLFAHDQPYSIFFELGFLVCTTYHGDSLVYAWDTVKQECGIFIGLEENLTEKLSIYPNPTSSFITFDFVQSAPTYLILRSIDGKVWKEQIIESGEHVSIKHVPSGVLIYEIHCNGTDPITGKIIKL